MDRAKVPVNHTFKKGYFVALRDAWFSWEPIIFEKVKASLRKAGSTENDIMAKLYYDVAFFRERVPRVVLPPSSLYWRVRAVYEVFGPAVDSNTGKPLFNDTAWAKAENVLKEILSGHASDPPGIIFYTQVGSIAVPWEARSVGCAPTTAHSPLPRLTAPRPSLPPFPSPRRPPSALPPVPVCPLSLPAARPRRQAAVRLARQPAL